MDWLDSFLYLMLISGIAFPLGRMIPTRWVHYDRFPFCASEWEEDGKIYHRLGIRKWQHHLLDMSRIMTKYMKRKELPENYTEDDIRYLLDETCIAEAVHGALCVLGMHCMHLWSGIGGIVFYILYVTLGQMPYIIIQRYNRPRLARLYQRVKRKGSLHYESTDTQLQYGRRS